MRPNVGITSRVKVHRCNVLALLPNSHGVKGVLMYDNKAALVSAGDVSVSVINNTVFVNSRLKQKVAMCNISDREGELVSLVIII